MLILHIMPDLTTGGAELTMKRLIECHLRDPRFEHRVISLCTLGTVGRALQTQGVPVEAFGLTSVLHLPTALLRLRERISAIDPDIVQTWMYHADLIGGIAARMAGMRNVIWGVRSTHIPPGRGTSPMTTAVRRACALLSRRLPTQIVYVAESSRRVHEGLGYDPCKGLVIPNGYRLPEAPTDQARRSARLHFGLPEDDLIVGSAGRYNALKDYPTFIAAAARLAESRSNVRFLLAGPGLQPDNVELVTAIAARGLANRFDLLGEQQDLGEFFRAIDLFCLHSISEGFPNVVAEAMALAVPCAVTNVGDAALIVGETGLVVPAERPDRLAQALERLMAEGVEARRNRGLLARERIAARFSMDDTRARYEALYAIVSREDEDKTRGFAVRPRLLRR
jgi:glycosyltransferase involved in cell wall biosynthesis